MSYGERLRSLGLLSLESTRFKIDMIIKYKIYHNLIDIDMDEAGLHLCYSVTRKSGLRLIPPVARTQLISNLFMFRIAHEWNLLLFEVIASPSLFLFKKRLRTWLETADFAFY